MAQIKISLSQAAVDGNQALSQVTVAPTNGLIGAVFDTLVSVGSTVARSYSDFSKATINGDTLTLDFAGDATIVYRHLVLADPSASVGLMQAAQFAFDRPGTLQFSQTGSFTLAYQFTKAPSGAMSIELQSLGGTATAARLESDYDVASPRYHPYLGNVGMAMTGTVGSDSAGKLFGSVTHVEQWADKLFKSINIDGDLQLSGDHGAISAGTGHVGVSGTITSYAKNYYDGSTELYSGMALALGPTEQFDLRMLANAAIFAGDDTIELHLPATIYLDLKIASGQGNDRIILDGGGNKLNADAGTGDDRILVGGGSHIIEGGPGIDTVQFPGPRASVNFIYNSNGALATTSGGVDIIRSTERFEWSDRGIAFDLDGVAGKAYRVYQAAFDRKPDLEGLSFWLHQMDKGAGLYAVAAGFVASAEFTALYGASPDDAAFLTRLYQNVLHRPYDQAGFDFWMSVLEHGTSRPVVLAEFSESPENRAQVIAAIQGGIDYLPMAELQIPVV